MLAQILENSRHFELIVAERDGTVAGTCYLNVIRGIGQAMMAFALERAWERGCYKAMLQTGSRSESTYRFYRACGFSQTEKVAFVARPPRPAAPDLA